MLLSYFFFNFKFKQFESHLNRCNQIILVSYNLQDFLINFYKFRKEKRKSNETDRAGRPVDGIDLRSVQFQPAQAATTEALEPR
jgi:hypothetical protein